MVKKAEIINSDPAAVKTPGPTKPGKPEKSDPKTIMLERKKERADQDVAKADKELQKHNEQQQKFETQQKKQDRLKSIMASRVARTFFKRAQAAAPPPDPNKDPAALYLQIKKTLNDIGLKSTMVWGRTTQIFLDKEKVVGGNNLKMYKIDIRDDANIDRDAIRKLNSENFETITEDNNDMVAYIWAPYTAPAEATPPPGEPGIE